MQADDTALIFDEDWYLEKNPDVKRVVEAGKLASGLAHYKLYGQKEGRIPAPPPPTFSPSYFLGLDLQEISVIGWALIDLRSGRPIEPDILKKLIEIGIARNVAGQPVLTSAGDTLIANGITVARLKNTAAGMTALPKGD